MNLKAMRSDVLRAYASTHTGPLVLDATRARDFDAWLESERSDAVRNAYEMEAAEKAYVAEAGQ